MSSSNPTDIQPVEAAPPKRKRREVLPERGMAFAISFLLSAAFLYFTPEYLGIQSTTRIVSLTMTLIGVYGLGLELNKMVGMKKGWKLDDLALGLVLGLVWIIFHDPTRHSLVNLVWLFVLLLAMSATTAGLVTILKSIVQTSVSWKSMTVKIAIFIVQITALIAGVLQSLQILHVIK